MVSKKAAGISPAPTLAIDAKFKEMKACSYGGYEINQCVREFEQNVNLKSTGLLNAVNRIILESFWDPTLFSKRVGRRRQK